MVWQPEMFAGHIQEECSVEVDSAHRLWMYDPEKGYYTLPESEWSVRRWTSALMVDPDFPAEYKPKNQIPRPSQGDEVIRVLQRRFVRIQPGQGNWLVCGNQTLQLQRPDKPHAGPHNPNYMLTAGIPHNYDPKTGWPLWTKFLNQTIPDEDDQRLLQQYAGACLLDRVPPKGVIYLWGQANTGKSTICRILTFLLGRDNVSAVSPHALSDERFAAADLFGKMANIVPDIPTEDVKNTSVYKQVSGGDLVRADVKYAKPLHFVSTATILYSGNDLPKSFNDPSDGYYSRQIDIHCPNVIKQPDPNVELALYHEATGILNWALTGLADLHDNRWQYAVPAKTRGRQLAAFEDANHELQWIIDRTLEATGQFLDRKEAYDDYQKWAEKQGLKPWGNRTFYGKIRKHWGNDRATHGKRGWDNRGLYI